MDRNQGRRLGAEEKLRVVEEGRQSEATISECWRNILQQIHRLNSRLNDVSSVSEVESVWMNAL